MGLVAPPSCAISRPGSRASDPTRRSTRHGCAPPSALSPTLRAMGRPLPIFEPGNGHHAAMADLSIALGGGAALGVDPGSGGANPANGSNPGGAPLRRPPD